jgi:hypothetical protein
MNKKRGRKKDSGVLSGIRPEREEWSDIRNRIIYGSAEWPLVALRSMLGSGLPDNFLSIEQAKYERALAAHVRERHAIADPQATGRKYPKPPKELWHALQTMTHKQPSMTPVIDAWRTLKTQFERAVLNGDADWFERQAKPIRKGGLPHPARFNAKVVYLLELAMWDTHARQRRRATEQKSKVNLELSKLIEQRKAEQAGMTKKQIETRKRKPYALAKGAEQVRKQHAFAASLKKQRGARQVDLTLTPAEKFTDAMASDIWKAVVAGACKEPEMKPLIDQEVADAAAVAERLGRRLQDKKKRQIIEQVVAEISGFKTKERAIDAIRKLAERLQF